MQFRVHSAPELPSGHFQAFQQLTLVGLSTFAMVVEVPNGGGHGGGHGEKRWCG